MSLMRPLAVMREDERREQEDECLRHEREGVGQLNGRRHRANSLSEANPRRVGP